MKISLVMPTINVTTELGFVSKKPEGTDLQGF